MNCPLAVRPPFEEVNSVRTMELFEFLITMLAVSLMAVSVRLSSMMLTEVDPPLRMAEPPYTWQSCVSQVLAYE
jgi:hypothetical protein